MGKKRITIDALEDQWYDAIYAIRDEAVKNAERAFTEGFMLGVQHAKRTFGEGENED